MITKDVFGRTGHMSSRILLGAAAYWDLPQADADASIEMALTYGLNHWDVAAGYGNAELYLGDWIRRHGPPSFLATKTGERTKAKAAEQIRKSLERLHVDAVDLIQLHFLVDPEEWEIAMGPGGALEAAIEARDEGLVKYIGVTGHGLTVAKMHLKALEKFDFDSVLLPYSYLMSQHAEYEKDFQALVKVCKERNVVVQTIKSMVHSPWGERTKSRNTWYRPLEEQEAIDKNTHWILGHEGLFLNSPGDIHILPKVLDAGERFEMAPADAEMQALMERLQMQNLFDA
ncbi:MAG: aldo/keto reductase [Anaerolineaceae bacterium]|nr:aldo/keto reductase [Anaerolineaceae bacterium]